ncbi:hypothetical protein PG988_006512 [Apiospora saccharicola]
MEKANFNMYASPASLPSRGPIFQLRSVMGGNEPTPAPARLPPPSPFYSTLHQALPPALPPAWAWVPTLPVQALLPVQSPLVAHQSGVRHLVWQGSMTQSSQHFAASGEEHLWHEESPAYQDDYDYGDGDDFSSCLTDCVLKTLGQFSQETIPRTEVQQLAGKIERFMFVICGHYAEHGTIPEFIHNSVDVNIDGQDDAGEVHQITRSLDQGVQSETETIAGCNGGDINSVTEEEVADTMFSPPFSTYTPAGTDHVAHETGKQ